MKSHYHKYIPTHRFIALGIVCYCLLFLGACRENLTDTQKPAKTVSSDTACQIALAPHAGVDEIDHNIQQYQKIDLSQSRALAQLERLGWAYISKARQVFDPGYYKLAEQTALCMTSLQDGNAAATLLLGHSLHNMHRFADAEQLARELTTSRGRWVDYGLLGDTLMEQGKLQEAAITYQTMMDLHPGPEAYNRAAEMRWLTGDLEGAIELMQLSVSSYQGQLPYSALWSFVKLAQYQLEAGQPDNSLQLINYVLANHPDYAPALLLRGKILLQANETKKAVDILTKAVLVNPLPEYRWALIEALQANQQLQKSQDIEAQLFSNGGTEDRRGFALYLATSNQQSDLAVTLARQEIELRQDVFSFDVLAWSLRANGQIHEAKKYSDKALAEGTRSARLFYHAGVISAESGQVHEAKIWLDYARQAQTSLWPSEREHLNRVWATL